MIKYQVTHNGRLISEHDTIDEAMEASEEYVENTFGDSKPFVENGKVSFTVNIFTPDADGDDVHNQISVGPCHK